jgi:hypothetical protein
MKRSKINLTHLHSTTMDAGYLVPILLQECLPNDNFRISMDAFVRASPMVAPLMHQVNFYTQYWFVPNRILWDNWSGFITGGEDGTYAPAFPTIVAPTGGFKTGSLADYFGFPIGQEGIEVSALPFRAVAEIWNTRYRDEDLQDEVSISYEDGLDTLTSTALLSPSWKKDYFTTARAATQRGVQVSVPIDSGGGVGTHYYKCLIRIMVTPGDVPAGTVVTNYTGDLDVGNITRCGTPPTLDQIKAVMPNPSQYEERIAISTGVPATTRGNSLPLAVTSTFVVVFVQKELVEGTITTPTWTGSSGPYTCGIGSPRINSSGQYYYNSVSIKTAGLLDIRDLRTASALQRFAERSLLWGNRYEEFIQREFGIRPRDSRIQRPEYLGGSKSALQITEVFQTAEGTDTGVGTMRGAGVATPRQRSIRFTCPEHGIIIGFMSIRPAPVYTQGIHREWLKRSRLDFFLPELANIGMQEVYQQELYATKDNKDVVFGYSDRYQEYRYRAPKVTGEFRTSTYNSWNMARFFDAPPVINSSFINMASSTASFKRPFADRTANSYLVMLRNNVQAYRPIPKYAKNILK